MIAVEAPVLELLLEQRAAHVGGVVQLARAVVVQDLPEHHRVSEKESSSYKTDSILEPYEP